MKLKPHTWNETFHERLVSYTHEVDGRSIVVEHGPARVCRETGEQLFSPGTVSRLQAIILPGADAPESCGRRRRQ